MCRILPVPSLQEVIQGERQERLVKEKESEFNKALAELPLKRQRLVLAILANPAATLTEQAKIAGLSWSGASKAMKEISGKLGPALLSLGITEADIIRALAEGLRAEHQQAVRVPEYDENGKVKGYRIEIVRTPDFLARDRALEKLLKLGAYFPDGKFQVDHRHRITHEISSETIEALKQREREQSRAIDADYEVTQ